MIDSKGQLVQASLNFDPKSNNTVYDAGQWKLGVVYNNTIQNPTSISAIKYTGNTSIEDSSTDPPSVIEPNSTFVYFVEADGNVIGINVGTYNRSIGPQVVQNSWKIGNSSIVSESKFAGVILKTGVNSKTDQRNGVDHKIFLQLAISPEQIAVLSRNFFQRFTSDPDLWKIGFKARL